MRWHERHTSASRILILTLLMCLTQVGCVIANYSEGNRIPMDRVESIQPGVTTKQDVLDMFGPPQDYTDASILEQLITEEHSPYAPEQLPDVIAYEFHEGRASGVVTLFVNVIKLEVDSDRLVIFFDENERVRYYGVHRGTRAN